MDGMEPDECIYEAGNSTDPYGCIDTDGDGAADDYDDFPRDPTQQLDSDGDGFSEGQLWAAELNNDDAIDIYDLLLLVDVIMGGSYAKTIDTSGPVTVTQQGNTVYLSTSDYVAGLQISLSTSIDEGIKKTVYWYTNNF